MRRCQLVLVIGLMTICGLTAQERPTTFYSRVSGAVVFLQHEFSLSSNGSAVPGLWERLAAEIGQPILDTPLALGSGSGFFVDTEGTILTNGHVVEEANLPQIRQQLTTEMAELLDEHFGLIFTSGERSSMISDFRDLVEHGAYSFAAWSAGDRLGAVEVLCAGEKGEPDLALVRLGGYTCEPLKLADSAAIGVAMVGDDAYSFGYPLGSALDAFFEQRVVTMNKGIVSAFRSAELGLQHSAAISQGNSGGPLLNGRGHVIGVNTATISNAHANSLFFAIDIGRVREFLAGRGFTNLLLWNDRLPVAEGSRPEEPRLNILGEFETSQNLMLEIAADTMAYLDGRLVSVGSGMVYLVSPTASLELRNPAGTRLIKLRLLAGMQGSTLLRPVCAAPPTTVNFVSTPEGAAVVADGRHLGLTPLTMELPAGSYAVSLRLDGAWFDDRDIEIVANRVNPVRFDGDPAIPMAFECLPVEPEATFHFNSRRGNRSFPAAETVALPAGDWQLVIAGSTAYEDVTIPVTVAAAPGSFDLSGFRRQSALEIRGMTPGALVWVDGLPMVNPGTGLLELPIGVHTVYGWAPGLLPLEPIRITVRAGGASFVTWDRLAGHDSVSAFCLWGGAGLGLGGAGLVAWAVWDIISDAAFNASESYDDYLFQTQLTNAKVGAGAVCLAGAIIMEIQSAHQNRLFRQQREYMESLEALE